MRGVIERGGRTVRLTAHKAILSGKHHGNTIGRRTRVHRCRRPAARDRRPFARRGRLRCLPRATARDTRRTARAPSARRRLMTCAPCDFLHDPSIVRHSLSEVVEAARGSNTELQLDLKDWRPMHDDRIAILLDVIAPVHEQVIVSTGQDWNLRKLHEADPELALGFDPGHYIDHAIEGSPVFLPRAMGAYGYRDDHPMAFGKTEPVVDYLVRAVELAACCRHPGRRSSSSAIGCSCRCSTTATTCATSCTATASTSRPGHRTAMDRRPWKCSIGWRQPASIALPPTRFRHGKRRCLLRGRSRRPLRRLPQGFRHDLS